MKKLLSIAGVAAVIAFISGLIAAHRKKTGAYSDI